MLTRVPVGVVTTRTGGRPAPLRAGGRRVSQLNSHERVHFYKHDDAGSSAIGADEIERQRTIDRKLGPGRAEEESVLARNEIEDVDEPGFDPDDIGAMAESDVTAAAFDDNGTLQWVDWFNNRRLLSPIGNIPPAEAEAHYYAQNDELAMVA